MYTVHRNFRGAGLGKRVQRCLLLTTSFGLVVEWVLSEQMLPKIARSPHGKIIVLNIVNISPCLTQQAFQVLPHV